MSALGSKLRSCEGDMLVFRCPGCNTTHAVRTGPNGWTFNGNGDAPTFSPSVLVTLRMWEPPVTPQNHAEWKRAPWVQTKVDRICHSFVTNGRIQFLSDCTHALAGQTVDLPDFSRASE